jgi:tetratricopeptide (TPR) repeat protein
MPILALSLSALLAAPLVSAHREPTPAEERIALAEKAIAARPGAVQGYGDLAFALASRARETADPVFYEKAQGAIDKALALAPDDFQALSARAWVLLGQHRFEKGRALAQQLNRRAPDDLRVYGYLVDANVELGRYDEAEEAAQWMLDLRPGQLAGLTRAAYLREIFGDVEGALQLMAMAFPQVSPAESEEQAWILTHMAHLQTLAGRPEVADPLLDRALELFPDYHYALAARARVRAAQGRLAEAAALLERRYELAPHPENLYDLALARARAGRTAESQRAFADFEIQARAESDGEDNANRELIFYYVDHAGRAADALRIAERELARRRDVRTLDAYAWALHANGRRAEAQKQMKAALAVGYRDSEMVRRAERIGVRVAMR